MTKNSEVEIVAESVDVIRTGREIILPSSMTYDEGIKWLERRRDEEAQVVDIDRTYPVFPSEGAIALEAVMVERYGWVRGAPIPQMFQPPKKPQLMGIEVGVGKVRQVPFGRFVIPGIVGFVQGGFKIQSNLPVFTMQAEVQKGFQREIEGLFDDIGRAVGLDSPYRGQALRLPLINKKNPANDLADYFPKFLDVRSADFGSMVFSKDTNELLVDNVFGPVVHTEDFRSNGIPLKMGVLLEGEYGCGKTLVANALAKVSAEHGWTYILCEAPSDLARCVMVARRYQPAIVFCEDIDRDVSGTTRTAAIDEVLNTIDGIEAKGTEIMVVLTTNHIDAIAPAMRRPGRLDVIVPIGPPDAEAVQRMIRLYAGDHLVPDANLQEVGELLSGRTPAAIREAVERSKRTAIAMEKPGRLDGEALARAARGMRTHLEFLNKTPNVPAGENVSVRVADAFERMIEMAENE